MRGWHEAYIGKPWASPPEPPRSFNCGELLRHVYRIHLGLETPPIVADPGNARSCARDIRNLRRYGDFYEVAMPRDFDLALMGLGLHKTHVGLVAGECVLHCVEGAGVLLEDIFAMLCLGWKMRFMRHVGAGHV